MKVAIKARVSLAAVAIALAMTAGPLSANHAWGNSHWARTANPFTLPRRRQRDQRLGFLPEPRRSVNGARRRS